MHGGSPIGPTDFADANLSLKKIDVGAVGQVYGYTGWTASQGYVSVHNPTTRTQTYSFCLDRKFGLVPNSGPFTLSCPMPGKDKGPKKVWNYGETVRVELQPREVIVLDFDRPGEVPSMGNDRGGDIQPRESKVRSK